MSGSHKYAGLRAIIYCRVSSDPTGRGFSVTDQEREGRAFCGREQITVAAVIVDNDRSASRRSKHARPGYTEVQDKLASGFAQMLVCWESSRAQRDLRIYVQVRDLCERYGVLYAYKGRVFDLSRPDDRFATGLDALIDERYADEVHERVMRGVASRVAKGTPHGKIPYGYRREYDPTTGAVVAQVPDPETAPVLQEIVRRVLAGEGIHTIAVDLNRRGVPTPQERRDQRRRVFGERAGWTSSKIRTQLLSPTPAAIRTHRRQRQEVEAAWPAIISAADHERVVRLLSDPARRTQRGTAPKYLLSGIAECGVCGAKLRRILNRGRPSYACAGPNYENSAHVVRRQEPLDDVVAALVVELLSNPAWAEAFRSRGCSDEVSQAASELTDLQARLAMFEDAAASGEITAAAFGRIETRLMTQIEDAQRRATPAWVPPVVTDLAGADAGERWFALPLVQQRLVVSTLYRVVIHKSGRPRGAGGFDLASVEITPRV